MGGRKLPKLIHMDSDGIVEGKKELEPLRRFMQHVMCNMCTNRSSLTEPFFFVE